MKKTGWWRRHAYGVSDIERIIFWKKGHGERIAEARMHAGMERRWFVLVGTPTTLHPNRQVALIS